MTDATTTTEHECDHGWRGLGDGFIEAEVARRKQRNPDVDEPVVRAALLNTVYPCKTCQPTLFYRWAGRHLDSDHDRQSCVECKALDPTTFRRGKAKAPGRMEIEGKPAPNTDPGPTPPPITEEF